MKLGHLREKARGIATGLGSFAVHIWQGDVTESDDMDVLSVEERDRSSNYRFERHRLNFVAGRCAIRGVLAGYLGCASRDICFEYGPHGKPVISQPSTSLMFNLSHSGPRIVIGIAHKLRLGIDVEACRGASRFADAIRANLDDKERERIDRTPLVLQDNLLLGYWTQKEACLKAIGVGLSVSPTLLHVEYNGDGRTRITNSGAHGQHYLFRKEIDCGTFHKGALVTDSEVTHTLLDI